MHTNNYDNLYGWPRTMATLQGHLTEQLTTDGISLGFEGVHWAGQSNHGRKTIPALRIGSRESTIATTCPNPMHVVISLHKWLEPWHGRMSLSAVVMQILLHGSVKWFKNKQSLNSFWNKTSSQCWTSQRSGSMWSCFLLLQTSLAAMLSTNWWEPHPRDSSIPAGGYSDPRWRWPKW